MFKNVLHVQNKIRLHVKYLLNFKHICVAVYLIYFFIFNFDQNGIKNNVTAVISLYMVSLENPENQNSEIAANTSESGT